MAGPKMQRTPGYSEKIFMNNTEKVKVSSWFKTQTGSHRKKHTT